MDSSGFRSICVLLYWEEFQNGTIRNTLSLGRNRMTYYVSKLLVTLLITTLGVVLITGLAMLATHLLSDLVKLRESKLWKLCSKSISCIASADIRDIICSSGFDIHH